MSAGKTKQLIQVWDKLSREQFNESGFFPSERYWQEWLGSASQKRILEIGCGQGRVLLNLAFQGNKVIGVDISQEMLSICQSRLRNHGIEIPLVCADTRHVPFRGDTFELVFSVGVVEHFVETANAIQEHARVCEPGGTVIVSVPHKGSFFHLFKIGAQNLGLFRFGFEQSFTKDELRQMTEHADVTITNVVAQEIVPESTTSVFRFFVAYVILLLDKLLRVFGLGGMTLIVRGNATKAL